jgi:hypothetical protein
MLGHASASMTLDVYAALFDDDLNAVADRPDEAHERSTAGKAVSGLIADREKAPESSGS